MKEDDIPKIDFYTYEGYYEFLVIPFILCNTLSTFHSFMNHISKPFLHHFEILIFDDILFYSKIWLDHVIHVDQVLQLLS